MIICFILKVFAIETLVERVVLKAIKIYKIDEVDKIHEIDGINIYKIKYNSSMVDY